MVLSKNQANYEPSDTPSFSDNLLILNFVMDPTHPSLAHQVDIVEELALKFETVIVLTGSLAWVPTASNIRVFTSNWRPGHNIENVFKFYRIFFRLSQQYKFVAVFSHMASIQSCLAGPILRFRKIKHFLWYAHAQNSIILRIAHFWVTKLVTSTVGSCPLSGKKILYLGQSINQNKFAVRANLTFPLRRFIHIGRADPSKNLNLIIETVFHFRQFDSDLRLEIVGNPSGSRQNIELESLKQFWADGINKGWLVFSPAIPRGQIPKLLHQHDVFIHAFKGSLDKTLIEATMTGLPVITINQEYVNEFGSWGGDPISLESELASLMNYVEKEVTERVRERTSIAIAKHSSITWIDNLEACLRSV